MSFRKVSHTAALAALVLSGAAFAATAAQKRKATRKPPAAAATPAPAKKNARPADDATQQADAATAVGEVPAKKNARAAEPAASPTPQPLKNGAADAARTRAGEVRYSFEFAQPEFHVSRYLIEHDAAGRGKITFERKGGAEPIAEPFDISPAAFARIVSAWEALKFLDSQESYQADKQFPHLGTMRLWMRSGGRERLAEFNWTSNEHAGALVREYKGLAEQQFFVFDMGLARQYQPSEAIKILKRLEILLNNNQISDATQLVALLRDLTTDERIPLIARNHAERLLKRIDKESKPDQ